MKRESKARRINRHEWVLEPLIDLPGCEVKAMFGCRSCYFNGLLVLVLADGNEEPWRGVLVPTERENHAALMRDFSALTPHSVLGKWLYLPESAGSFERDAQKIVDRIRRLDPLLGVVPPARKKRKN